MFHSEDNHLLYSTLRALRAVNVVLLALERDEWQTKQLDMWPLLSSSLCGLIFSSELASYLQFYFNTLLLKQICSNVVIIQPLTSINTMCNTHYVYVLKLSILCSADDYQSLNCFGLVLACNVLCVGTVRAYKHILIIIIVYGITNIIFMTTIQRAMDRALCLEDVVNNRDATNFCGNRGFFSRPTAYKHFGQNPRKVINLLKLWFSNTIVN